MLKQFGSASAAIPHDGVVFRRYREKIFLTKSKTKSKLKPPAFKPQAWNGEARMLLPALGGELRFQRVRGRGIDGALLKKKSFQIRMRAGGERLRTDARRPSRTLKNLFQEAGVPPWERARMPLIFCGKDLVWAPGLGVDAKYLSVGRAPGIVPDWRPSSS
jgi:tRNA(Ile)-lysidine synthase